MDFDHPSISISEPAPGHYVITGHNPAPVFVEDEGTVTPPRETYIPPELPDEVLLAVLADREARRNEDDFSFDEPNQSNPPKKEKKK